MADVRTAVEQKLASLQEGNEKKLEQMRATVDEKLQSTLEQRLGESFKQVADRLEQVHRGPGRNADAGARRRVAESRAEQREDARHARRSATRRVARAGVRAGAVRHATSRPCRAATRASISRFACRGGAKTARRCGCRSTASFRATTTSGCSMRTSAPIARRRGVGEGDRNAAAPRGTVDPREVRRHAVHHRLRHPVRADRRPVRRSAAPARPGGVVAARASGHARRPDHAAGDADQPADGLSHAGAGTAQRRSVGSARRREDRVRQVRQGAVARQRPDAGRAQHHRPGQDAHAADDAQAEGRRIAARANAHSCCCTAASRRPKLSEQESPSA